MAAARHRQRRLHPHDRAPPLPRRREAAAGLLRRGRHRARHLRGPVLRGVRGVLHRGRAGRRQLPDPRHACAADEGGELLLQAQPLRRPLARVVRGPSRRGAAGVAAQRGARLHPPRPSRLLDQPHVAQVGHPDPVGRAARHLRVVRRARELHHRDRVRRRRSTLQDLVARASPHRQGHPPLSLRVLAGDAAVGRARAARDASTCTAGSSSPARR